MSVRIFPRRVVWETFFQTKSKIWKLNFSLFAKNLLSFYDWSTVDRPLDSRNYNNLLYREKMIRSEVEPIPESLLEIAWDLSNLSSSGTKVHRETDYNVFMPPEYVGPDGIKHLSENFLHNYGSPSPYHPFCCSIKSYL